ncbi:L-fucose-proton symporter [Pedobacter sp. Bi27]|uniref:sugar MFS transporter n=1 Tax=unclassified Pedobacter TaxID=2628915 RepID=UPI001DB5751B|nr:MULTISPECIES: sugar MFS transporter [unclassified Pedobacter]CAH0135562.1 L-fucose-proton symporter [Pedobacter sp. Bi126]CAH0135679.1 L-fucose-proton symporter [Pedobacter sp. Bi27]CAH0222855.1 L-fucose-proton symporter [Pedobacter sp. Bi36]
MSLQNSPIQVSSLTRKDMLVSISIIGLLFFIFGFVTWINAILIPFFKIACELNNFESYLVAFAFYIAYLVMSLPAGYLLKKIGFKKGMMCGFWVMALGAMLFIPAGLTRTYPLFLSGLFTLGIGLAILQTAANPYITILGPQDSAAQRFSIMGICNKMAGILAPLLFAAVILRPETDNELFRKVALMVGTEKEVMLNEIIGRVVIPYAVVSLVLLLLGFLVRYSPLPEIDTEHEDSHIAVDNADKKSIFDFPHLVFGAVAIFFHVGSQVIAVDSIVNYASHQGMAFMEAKTFPSYTLTATIIGYLLGISFIPKLVSQLTALKVCTVLGLILSLCILAFERRVAFFGHHTDISVWFIVSLGFANSMIWAGVWPLALNNLGRFIKTGASLLIMGLCGNAIMPLLYGYWADQHSLREAYWVLLPCYTYLIFYAFYAYRLKDWKFTTN